MKKVLTVAGSDSSGGAGIQADLKTFAALGIYGMSCICALTAQNTKGVTLVENASPSMVKAQLEAVYEDIYPDAVKTGMLSSPAIVDTVAEFLKEHSRAPLVVDPVMVATSGDVLLEEGAIRIYKEKLIPLATLITPNIPEAEVLSGMTIRTISDMEAAAKRLGDLGRGAVLVKGGHRVEEAHDVLWDGRELHHYETEKIESENTHGTGCTLSSALAAMLAKGYPLPAAVAMAKRYITGAIRGGKDQKIGHGHGPVDHFWLYGEGWGRME